MFSGAATELLRLPTDELALTLDLVLALNLALVLTLKLALAVAPYTHNRYSTASLREVSADAFGKSVVTLAHSRKYARKGRDYMRAYRAGARGLGADTAVQMVKSHRSALDSHTSFVIDDSVD